MLVRILKNVQKIGHNIFFKEPSNNEIVLMKIYLYAIENLHKDIFWFQENVGNIDQNDKHYCVNRNMKEDSKVKTL